MEPISRSVEVTRPAARASGLAHMEARRLGHHYLGPEHLLVGLLVEGDNLAARVLVANGLDLDTVRAGIDRLVAEGVLPGPQPSDDELLASLGVDLQAVHTRLQATFGEHAYWDTARRIRHRAALEAEEPIGTDRPAQSRRERVLLGLPDHGPKPVRLLVEGDGRTLQGLLDALLAAMEPTR